MNQSNLPTYPTPPMQSEDTAMVIAQLICDVMRTEQSRATKDVVTSLLGIIAFIGLAIGGVVFCEFKYIYGWLDFTTVMLLCTLLMAISYFASMHFFCIFDIAREKYKDLIVAAAKGVTITSEMEKDFEEGRRIIVKITPKLDITIDSFDEDELGEQHND